MITICGRPNVGKSTLTNALVGEKIAIVSPKPQTTRSRITAIFSRGETQFVLLDTPGFHKPKTKLGEKMVQAVSDSISGVDCCMFVVDAADEKLNAAELELINKFKAEKMPVILAINKIDMVKEKTDLMKKIAEIAALYDFIEKEDHHE